MGLTAGFLTSLLLLLGVAAWRLLQQRRDCLFQAKVIAATGSGVVVTDATTPRHPIVSVNSAFRLLTGYAESEVLGQTTAILAGPRTDRASVEKLALALQDGRACRVRLLHYRKNETSFWNEVTLSPVKDRAGRLTSVIWVMNDVTSSHQEETGSKEMSGFLEALPDHLSDGIMVVHESAITYVNPSGLTILGAGDAEQIIGKPLQLLLSPGSFPNILRQAELRRPDACVPPTPGCLLRLDGGSVEASLSSFPILWQGKTSCLLLIRPTPSPFTAVAPLTDRSQLRQDSAHALSRLGKWERDVATGIEIWSDEQYRIFGFEPGAVLPTYDTFKAVLHPEDRERMLAAIDQALASDAPYDMTGRIVQPSGSLRVIRCRGVVIRNFEGEPTRILGTVEDKSADEPLTGAVRDRDLPFTTVLESAPCGMLLIGRDGLISMANAAGEQLFGYSQGELCGKPVEWLIPERDRSHDRDARTELLSPPAGESVKVVRTLHGLRKDGVEFPIEISLSPLSLAAETWILATVVDSSARQRKDGTIQDVEARFDLAVAAAHVGSFEHDHRTDTVSWSPILCNIFGVAAEEPASLQRYIELIRQADRPRILSAIRAAHDPTGDGRFQVEHEIVRPDGSVRHVRVHALTSFEGDGSARTASRTIGAVVDITDHANANSCRDDSAKMEAFGTLAGGIAHEFNNSLTAVLGFSQLALPLIPADNKAHRYIQHVITAGRKSRELVHQLLTFGRRGNQHRHPLSLHILVKESLKLLRPTIPSWIELREQIATSTSPIEADAAQMHEMLLNIVGSALYAMRSTGGALGIHVQDQEFATDQPAPHSRIPAGRYVCLRVTHSGGDIDTESAPHGSDPVSDTAHRGEQQNMGLSVVHGIVAAHGGAVLVDRRPGQGTTVSMYFPALPTRTSSVHLKDEPLPRGHECILFVDDDPSLARFGGEMLESLGYYPVVRTNATEAWQAFLLAPQRFALLMTDETMPGIAGDQLIRRCREVRPDLPVILCAGSEQQLSEEEARSRGISEFVLKPLMVADLARRIRRVLDHPSPSIQIAQAEASPNTESPTPSDEECYAVGPGY